LQLLTGLLLRERALIKLLPCIGLLCFYLLALCFDTALLLIPSPFLLLRDFLLAFGLELLNKSPFKITRLAGSYTLEFTLSYRADIRRSSPALGTSIAPMSVAAIIRFLWDAAAARTAFGALVAAEISATGCAKGTDASRGAIVALLLRRLRTPATTIDARKRSVRAYARISAAA